MFIAPTMPILKKSTQEPEWKTDQSPSSYTYSVKEMEKRVSEIRLSKASELIWLLEHPAIYTAGTNTQVDDLIDVYRFPVYRTGRGGQYTYHGPGQLVVYVMLDLNKHGRDLRSYVTNLELWIITALAEFGVVGTQLTGKVGIWVDRGNGRKDKIAAIGVRVRRWVTYHGFSINISPDLSHYDGIIPCGISDPSLGITSLADLGINITKKNMENSLRKSFKGIFAK
jgi:lipoyl(octanoyl) transferase|tara:strand:- start:2358 stop:3035 length:678 start_codon:yes stop_codon:yes gene_type:complete